MSSEERSVTLSPSWKNRFWYYFFGILLLPVGLGLFILIYVWKQQSQTEYILRDRSITYRVPGDEVTLELADIRSTDLKASSFGLSDIILRTNTRELSLSGIEDGAAIHRSIDMAIEAELKRLEAEKRAKPRETKYKPGAMDELEYLTGLWQQGLITNEEYDAQRQNLEAKN